MKIGLIRHFKVNYKNYHIARFPDEYREAIKHYDEAEIISRKTFLGNVNWQICFSSSLKRAIETANIIYKGEIILTDLLREVSLSPFTNKHIKLPWFVWHIGARIAWGRNGRSQEETKRETDERIEKIFLQITETGKENILVVSHGFFMKCFSKFLIDNGFRGKIDNIPHNGRLYIFEKH